jgi:hypothetical protein
VVVHWFVFAVVVRGWFGTVLSGFRGKAWRGAEERACLGGSSYAVAARM